MRIDHHALITFHVIQKIKTGPSKTRPDFCAPSIGKTHFYSRSRQTLSATRRASIPQ
jgi:hypothetical protein